MNQPNLAERSPATADIDRCADRIMDVVPRAMHRIRAEMRSQASPRLTVPQMRALLFVQRRPDASLSEVAEHLGASPSTCSVLVDRLVRHALVERTTDPGERRRVCLRATEEGGVLVTRARQRTRAWLRQTLGPLSPAELDGLLLAMDLLESITARAPQPDGLA